MPRRTGPAPQNAETVSIIAQDKVSLSAWWLRPSSANGNCVIVLHGIADSRVSSVGLAPMFLNEGYAVLTPDSRAHGASGGQFVTYGLLEEYDVITWAAWMKSAGCRKLYGLGESLGASILIETAAIQPVFASIVAECPYADLREVARYRVRHMTHAPAFFAGMVVNSAMLYARWADGLNLSQVSPVSVIARVSTPILLIHGSRTLRLRPVIPRNWPKPIREIRFGSFQMPDTPARPRQSLMSFAGGCLPGLPSTETEAWSACPKAEPGGPTRTMASAPQSRQSRNQATGDKYEPSCSDPATARSHAKSCAGTAGSGRSGTRASRAG